MTGFGPMPNRPVNVWYRAPRIGIDDAPILVVMPGRRRNAQDYRDEWAEAADANAALLLVPELPEEEFAFEEYNLGNLVGDDGPLDPGEWTFGLIDGIVERAAADLGRDEEGFLLYGHSAGAQFVHRYVLFTGASNVEGAVTANAGWYTMPDPNIAFPYGIDGAPPADLEAAFAAPLTVLVGEDDDDPDAPGLRRDAGSDAQGTNRFERGLSFFESSRSIAEAGSHDFAWRFEVAPGVGHSNAAMAPIAADFLFG